MQFDSTQKQPVLHLLLLLEQLLIAQMPPQLCMYTGEQLHRDKRLCHIVIRTDIQTGNLINIFRFGR